MIAADSPEPVAVMDSLGGAVAGGSAHPGERSSAFVAGWQLGGVLKGALLVRLSRATPRRTALFLARVLGVAVVYSLLNVFAAHMEVFTGVSMLFPASAAGVVAAMLWPTAGSLAVFLATLATPWHQGDPFWVRALFALGNTVEALLPALILPRRRVRQGDLQALSRGLWWVCFGNTLLNYVIAVGPQVLVGREPIGRELVFGMLAWWAADAAAIAIFALPVLLYLRPGLFFEHQNLVNWSFLRNRRLHAKAFGLILAVSGLILLSDHYLVGVFNWPAIFYLVPICWLMLRGGLSAASTAAAEAGACYFVTLALEAHLGLLQTRSAPERMLVIYGNLFAFYLFSVFAGTIHSRNQLLVSRLRHSWEALRRSFDATVTAFAAAVEARDPATRQHLDRVSQLAAETARRLGLSRREVKLVRYGAILHDIGKIGVPEAILLKPGPLTDAEMALVQSHAEIGALMLGRTGLLEETIPLVRYHEERWDGRTSGPFAANYGLRGADIPLGARIIAVADAFDAMVSERPYRATPGSAYALEELRREAGGQFDPEVVRVFLELLAESDGVEMAEPSMGTVAATGAASPGTAL